jgi:phenylalanyl-tRNA synthetase beta chain
MPQATLSTRTLFQILGSEISPREVEDLLFRTKVELHEVKDPEMMVEVTHDRLDLLCESGLANLLSGLLHQRPLATLPPTLSPSGFSVRVDPSVAPLRPEIALAVVRAPEGSGIDAGLLSELIKFQEILHTSLGINRREGSIGLYPLRGLVSPLTYSLEKVEGLRFTPLAVEGVPSSGEQDVSEFLSSHPMALKYGSLGHTKDRTLVLKDSAGTLLSLPPILNAAKHGEIRVGEKEVLIESTGKNSRTVRDLVGYMMLPFVTRGWTVHSTTNVVQGNGPSEPRWATLRKVAIASSTAEHLLGRPIGAAKIHQDLMAAGFDAEVRGPEFSVRVPPWRPDVLGEVDLVEEVMVLEGIASFPPQESGHQTQGRMLPLSRYSEKLAEILLGMGYQEAHTPVLLPRDLSRRLCPEKSTLELSNPVSEELSVVRSTLLPSLMLALSLNTGQSYPQRLYEIADVVEVAPETPTGSSTRLHLCAVLAGEGAGFANAMALLERLMRAIGSSAVREPGNELGGIPGRVAELSLAGEKLAVVGEVHPEILVDLKLQQPVCWTEIDLTLLWTLKGNGPRDAVPS